MPTDINILMDYMIPIMAIAFFSFVVSFTIKKGFSANIFLTGFSVGINLFAWLNIFPIYMIIFSALIFGAILLTESGDVLE